MTTHSSVLAWRIPGTGHPAMGLHRVDTTEVTQQQQQQLQHVYVNTSLLIYPFWPPLSPLVAISLFSQSVSLFLFCK